VDWRAVLLVFCLNDLVDFEWEYKSGEGVQLSDEMTDAGSGLSVTSETEAGLTLAALRLRFRRDPATAPLAEQTNTTLWAWNDGKWNRYLADTLGPFVSPRSGPPVFIVIAPTQSQLQSLNRGGSRSTVLYPQVRMQTFCAQHALTCIDLSDAFRDVTSDDLSKFFLDDLHFSEEGHRLVADYLWPRVNAILKQPALDHSGHGVALRSDLRPALGKEQVQPASSGRRGKTAART